MRKRDEHEIAYETPALRVLLRSSTGSVEVSHVSHGDKLQPFFICKINNCTCGIPPSRMRTILTLPSCAHRNGYGICNVNAF